jgi:hypothetical protein
MKDFHKLLVWQEAHQVTLDLYPITQTFPAEERYGLTSQIRRSSARSERPSLRDVGKEVK